MTTFENDGVTLAFDDNDASGTPSFVFVHGWTCNRSFFAPQFEHFGRDHRAIAVDLRGHGESSPANDGDYSVATFASDVAALIEHLGIAPAVVVGHSLGAVIAAQLTGTRPDLVAAAVLVDVAPIVLADDMRGVFEGLFQALRGPDSEATFAAMVSTMFLETDNAARRAEITAAMTKTPLEIAIPAIEGILANGSAALAAVTRPIVSIGAAVPFHENAVLKAVNPNIVIGQTVGAGHFNQLEVPGQVNAMIEQFLSVNGI